MIAGPEAPAPPEPPPSSGPRFALFCHKFIRQTKGRFAGQPLNLGGYELEFWREALELDPATGIRIYQEVGLGLPTKNGKSTQASAFALYMGVADGEPEPEVIIGAAAKPQARIVLNQARSMALASPLLLDHLRVMVNTIEVPRTNGIIRVVAADGALQHGANPSANVIDEIHAHKNSDLYTALTKSGAAREQAITFWITTEGGTGEGLLAELKGQMFAGNGELERRPGLLIYRDKVNGILVYWYGADRDADIEDPAVWRLVNPGLGTIIDPRWLAGQFAKLKGRGALDDWRMYHLNMEVDRTSRAVGLAAFKACADRERKLREDLPIGVGIYRTSDGSQGAIVAAQRQPTDAGEPVVVVRVWHFPPGPNGSANAIAMRLKLLELRATYPLPQARDPKTKAPKPGPAIAWASNYLSETAETLTAEGVNMVKFPLYAGTMGPASTTTSELIATRRLVHDGDLTLIEHVDRTDATLTDRGRQWIASSAPHHNPSAIALVPAVAMAMQDAPPPRRPRLYGSA